MCICSTRTHLHTHTCTHARQIIVELHPKNTQQLFREPRSKSRPTPPLSLSLALSFSLARSFLLLLYLPRFYCGQSFVWRGSVVTRWCAATHLDILVPCKNILLMDFLLALALSSSPPPPPPPLSPRTTTKGRKRDSRYCEKHAPLSQLEYVAEDNGFLSGVFDLSLLLSFVDISDISVWMTS